MTRLLKNRTFLIVASIGVVGAGIAIAAAIRAGSASPPAPADERKWVEVERVYDGDTVKVDPDDKLIYAGIRAPQEGERFHEEAKARNAKLVEGANAAEAAHWEHLEAVVVRGRTEPTAIAAPRRA